MTSGRITVHAFYNETVFSTDELRYYEVKSDYSRIERVMHLRYNYELPKRPGFDYICLTDDDKGQFGYVEIPHGKEIPKFMKIFLPHYFITMRVPLITRILPGYILMKSWHIQPPGYDFPIYKPYIGDCIKRIKSYFKKYLVKIVVTGAKTHTLVDVFSIRYVSRETPGFLVFYSGPFERSMVLPVRLSNKFNGMTVLCDKDFPEDLGKELIAVSAFEELIMRGFEDNLEFDLTIKDRLRIKVRDYRVS